MQYKLSKLEGASSAENVSPKSQTIKVTLPRQETSTVEDKKERKKYDRQSIMRISKIVPDPIRRRVHTAGMSWTAGHNGMLVI